jgi:hypothetical protein
VQFPSATHLLFIFELERDARRVLEVLPKRLAKYALALNPDKTRLIDFRRPDRRGPASAGDASAAGSRPGTFDLLGFTHYWGKSRNGYWVVKQKTAADRFGRALTRIAEWCRDHPHQPVPEQWAALRQKLSGHFGYFAVTGNSLMVYALRRRAGCVWRKWLSRRSQRAALSWEAMNRLLARYPLPQPRLRAFAVTW